MEMIRNVNKHFEILGLLYITTSNMDYKESVMIDLEKFGLNGEVFFQKYYLEIEKYIQTFKEHKVTHKAFSLGQLNDYSFFLMMSTILLEYPELFDDINCLSDNEYRKKLIENYRAMYEAQDKKIDTIEKTEDIISFVDQTKLPEELKWHFMKVLKSPKIYYQKLIQQIIDNEFAYKKALKKVKSLNQYIEHCELVIKENKLLETQFFSAITLFENEKIYPSIIFFGSFIAMGKIGFFGILLDQMIHGEMNRKNEKRSLLMKLKALGDSSKFDILLSIKEAPKYNLELAEEMNLNPSTISHHMNNLMLADLVKISKKNGKVYYVIQQQEIEKLKKSLDRFLID